MRFQSGLKRSFQIHHVIYCIALNRQIALDKPIEFENGSAYSTRSQYLFYSTLFDSRVYSTSVTWMIYSPMLLPRKLEAFLLRCPCLQEYWSMLRNFNFMNLSEDNPSPTRIFFYSARATRVGDDIRRLLQKQAEKAFHVYDQSKWNVQGFKL
jgi:hypothetical protein